jgi:glucarate dehydratase
VRITGPYITLVTIPFTRPELWAWGERTGLHATGLPIVSHAFSPGTITMHAQLSVVGSSPGFILANQGHQDLLAGDVVTMPLSYEGGRMAIPTGPGLWSELDRARLDEYGASFQRHGSASAHSGQADQMTTVPSP